MIFTDGFVFAQLPFGEPRCSHQLRNVGADSRFRKTVIFCVAVFALGGALVKARSDVLLRLFKCNSAYTRGAEIVQNHIRSPEHIHPSAGHYTAALFAHKLH